MQPKGHTPYGAPAKFYAWETIGTGQVRWQWNDEDLAMQYCVNNSLTLMKTDETNTRDYFTAPAPTLEQCREIAGLISDGDIDRLMERDGACVEWVCGEYERLQAENRALRSALEEIGGYYGEGSMNTPWREIVRDMGALARSALLAALRSSNQTDK